MTDPKEMPTAEPATTHQPGNIPDFFTCASRDQTFTSSPPVSTKTAPTGGFLQAV
jgi:hypothetical protein